MEGYQTDFVETLLTLAEKPESIRIQVGREVIFKWENGESLVNKLSESRIQTLTSLMELPVKQALVSDGNPSGTVSIDINTERVLRYSDGKVQVNAFAQYHQKDQSKSDNPDDPEKIISSTENVENTNLAIEELDHSWQREWSAQNALTKIEDKEALHPLKRFFRNQKPKIPAFAIALMQLHESKVAESTIAWISETYQKVSPEVMPIAKSIGINGLEMTKQTIKATIERMGNLTEAAKKQSVAQSLSVLAEGLARLNPPGDGLNPQRLNCEGWTIEKDGDAYSLLNFRGDSALKIEKAGLGWRIADYNLTWLQEVEIVSVALKVSQKEKDATHKPTQIGATYQTFAPYNNRELIKEEKLNRAALILEAAVLSGLNQYADYQFTNVDGHCQVTHAERGVIFSDSPTEMKSQLTNQDLKNIDALGRTLSSQAKDTVSQSSKPSLPEVANAR